MDNLDHQTTSASKKLVARHSDSQTNSLENQDTVQTIKHASNRGWGNTEL